MRDKTKVLAFWGAPGAGKTTAALDMTAAMKMRGLDVEYVPEIARELVLTGNIALIRDQIYLYGEQHRRLYSNLGKVEWIVTDIALPMMTVYMGHPDNLKHYGNSTEAIKGHLENLMFEGWSALSTIDVLLKRDHPYKTDGRIEDAAASAQLEGAIEVAWARASLNSMASVMCKASMVGKIVPDLIDRHTTPKD